MKKRRQITKTERQNALIKILSAGPCKIHNIEELLMEELQISNPIPEATRNRDLRDLRNRGFDIQLVYNRSRSPEYILRTTSVNLPCDLSELPYILDLVKIGMTLGLISNDQLEKTLLEQYQALNLNSKSFRLDGLRKLTNLNKIDLKQIREAINKHHSISFKYKQPSNSKIREFTVYPIEIFIQDKYLYLSCKRKNKTGTLDWREYRLDRFVDLGQKNFVIGNKKDIDSNPLANAAAVFVRVEVYPPLNNFFEPGIWNLEKTYSSKNFDIYEAYIKKPRFRILKDFLAFLPYIKIIGDKDLSQEFNEIIKKTYARISK